MQALTPSLLTSLPTLAPTADPRSEADSQPATTQDGDRFVSTPFVPASVADPRARGERAGLLPALPAAEAADTSAHAPSRLGLTAAVLVAATVGAGLAAPLVAAPPASAGMAQEVQAPQASLVRSMGKPVPTQSDAAIEAAWVRSGGADGPLGMPTGPIVDIGVSPWNRGAHMQTYVGGSIVKHESGKAAGRALVLSSPMTTAWIEAGGAQSALGLPLTDEVQERPSYYATTSRIQEFEGGCVRTHTSGGRAGEAYVVRPLFYSHYDAMGGAQTWLGLPVSNDYKSQGGLRQDFEGGAIIRDIRGNLTWRQYAPSPKAADPSDPVR